MSDDILEDYKAAARFIKAIEVGEEAIILETKDEEKTSYLFENLTKVSIIATDEGPFLDDTFWLMMFKIIIMIPQGVTGEEKLLERLQQLPDFDNDAVIKAMACSENDAFHVWEK